MKALKYVLTAVALLLFAGACATPPEDEPEVAAVPDNLVQLQSEAEELRAEILEFGLDAYEEEQYALGNEAFARAEGLLSEDPQEAADLYEEAIERFESVIAGGFPALLVDRQSEVEGARQDAIDARARTAAASLFEEAEDLLDQAVTMREEDSYRESYGTFAEAETRFGESTTRAHERRDEARAALDRLDERIREAEDEASELEEELEEEEEELEEEVDEDFEVEE